MRDAVGRLLVTVFWVLLIIKAYVFVVKWMLWVRLLAWVFLRMVITFVHHWLELVFHSVHELLSLLFPFKTSSFHLLAFFFIIYAFIMLLLTTVKIFIISLIFAHYFTIFLIISIIVRRFFIFWLLWIFINFFLFQLFIILYILQVLSAHIILLIRLFIDDIVVFFNNVTSLSGNLFQLLFKILMERGFFEILVVFVWLGRILLNFR